MLNILFLPEGWEDYLYWQTQDKKTLRRINALIRDIQRSPFEGLGKPEPLKGNYQGWWSRRIKQTGSCTRSRLDKFRLHSQDTLP